MNQPVHVGQLLTVSRTESGPEGTSAVATERHCGSPVGGSRRVSSVGK